MTERVASLHRLITSGGHRALRAPLSPDRSAELAAKIQDPGLPLAARAALRLRLLLEEERIMSFPGERIPGLRTIPDFPDIYAPGERERLQAGFHVHEQGRVCNLSSDWDGVLKEGLSGRRARAEKSLAEGLGDADFLAAALETIDAVIAYADRYGLADLSKAVRDGAKGYLDALRLFRILHLSLWASNVYHNTVGRFDQYMWPFLQGDLEAKRLNMEEALDLTEEFFLSFNRDSDLYTGMQQGDNGQSLMLGGCDAAGACAVNPLTGLCLQASLNLRCIDPKINLRVTGSTPLELYEQATQLTRQGLGFPQYANDDVVIPALVKQGYSLEDARNYTVAACWEFIIPGVGMDIPNIGAVSLAGATDAVIREKLPSCERFDCLLEELGEEIGRRVRKTAEEIQPLWMEPAPFQSVLMAGCLDKGQDISQGARYNNYGFHGTGFATAVDQLAAVADAVFEAKDVSSARLLSALRDNFEKDTELRHRLRVLSPKLGKDAEAETLADWLLDTFYGALKDLRNERGGVIRAGTGSAMYYLWHAAELGATADGRRAGEPLSANFSPSLTLRDAGPLSVIRAMARPGLSGVMNGGPLTLELHDTVFRSDESVAKVAQLVRAFITLGGHQLQLNAVSGEKLLKAQANPEAHGDLIVRVWGWSGHFVALDKAYQDQIIARTSYSV